jgi:S-adenosyl methyltransferase
MAVMTDDATNDAGIDATVPHSARIWNYWLGGRDNYEVDRQAGDEFAATYPEIVTKARTCRHFLARAVRYLAAEAGIRQFLDIGTGLPTMDNTHEVAQQIAPDAKIVYVDNDPLVLVHARALLTDTTEYVITTYVQADLHDPDRILAEAAGTLDFQQPIAVMLLGVLGHISDYDQARSIVGQLMDAVPSGSYLAQYDGTNTSPAYVEAIRRYAESGAVPYNLRSPEQVARYFDGLELVEPGVVSCPLWRPDDVMIGTIPEVDEYGGVGRKP